MNYEKLEKELRHAPETWVPALLAVLIRRDRVFRKPDGLMNFVQSVLEKESNELLQRDRSGQSGMAPRADRAESDIAGGSR